ncbi:GerAB/ArcD/ProY family transporter [Thermoanaerobacterium saccharolyticum]|uniref:Spore germination protein n=2 Tax=Thermoanaerobacterium TaxID=28895 RepID=W9E7D1_9THEO|nr:MULTISPECIES: GerAB/ArcD/ProY family transporter [Thermoanaerobacterium]AFK86197.1 spore germination protein [Thermoanaerobacterium saccharolyticum JW/SL-YS485]ETO37308.1 spore germination protein [Thermoanaerobacterium aotearoense SCUT27]
MNKITYKELFSAMLAFELGSAVLFVLGASAKQDAWMSILLATVAALPLIYLYVTLYKMHDGNLPQILEATFGKAFGKVLSAIYAFYFLYIAARVTRDFAELNIGTIYKQAPVSAFSIAILVVVIYYLMFDISVMIKSSHVLLPTFIIMAFFQFIGAFSVNGESIKKIFPILGNGFMPVVKAAFPNILTFPYGELITFMMVFPEFKFNTNKLAKYCFTLVIATGLWLALNTVEIFSVIGVAEATRANFPFYELALIMKFGTFRNLDPFYAIETVIGGVIKITVFAYAAIKTIQTIFNLKEYKFLLIPVGTIIFALSLLIADSYPLHILIGLKLTTLYIHVPLQIIIPLIALILSFIRNPKTRKNK